LLFGVPEEKETMKRKDRWGNHFEKGSKNRGVEGT